MVLFGTVQLLRVLAWGKWMDNGLAGGSSGDLRVECVLIFLVYKDLQLLGKVLIYHAW